MSTLMVSLTNDPQVIKVLKQATKKRLFHTSLRHLIKEDEDFDLKGYLESLPEAEKHQDALKMILFEEQQGRLQQLLKLSEEKFLAEFPHGSFQEHKASCEILKDSAPPPKAVAKETQPTEHPMTRTRKARLKQAEDMGLQDFEDKSTRKISSMIKKAGGTLQEPSKTSIPSPSSPPRHYTMTDTRKSRINQALGMGCTDDLDQLSTVQISNWIKKNGGKLHQVVKTPKTPEPFTGQVTETRQARLDQAIEMELDKDHDLETLQTGAITRLIKKNGGTVKQIKITKTSAPFTGEATPTRLARLEQAYELDLDQENDLENLPTIKITNLIKKAGHALNPVDYSQDDEYDGSSMEGGESDLESVEVMEDPKENLQPASSPSKKTAKPKKVLTSKKQITVPKVKRTKQTLLSF